MKEAVCAFIERENGDVLAVLHKSGNWCLPGGKVENGESYQVALRRELSEEVDARMSDRVSDYLYSARTFVPRDETTVFVFRAHVAWPHPSETGVALGWFTREFLCEQQGPAGMWFAAFFAALDAKKGAA